MKKHIKNAIAFVKNKKNLSHTICICITALSFLLSGFIFGPDSVFIKPLPFKNAVLQYIYSSIPTVLMTYFIFCITGYVNKIVYHLLHKVFNHTSRSETILKMLYSFIKYGLAIVMVLITLTLWGVDSGALIASAGGLALVIGLGAQSLISDILAGVFIVFEGEFNVGDIVVIDGWRGKVISIGIRSTKFKDIYGDIKTINNSQITTVVNKTKELSMADVVIGINYSESLEKVEAIIRKEIDGMNEKVPEAEEEIKYLGVQDLNASSVDLLFITYCREENIMGAKRKIRRELKLIFDRYNIEIPYQHITLEVKPEAEKAQIIDVEEEYYNTDTNEDFENLLFNKATPEKESVINKDVFKKKVEEEYIPGDGKTYNILCRKCVRHYKINRNLIKRSHYNRYL